MLERAVSKAHPADGDNAVGTAAATTPSISRSGQVSLCVAGLSLQDCLGRSRKNETICNDDHRSTVLLIL